MTSRQRLLNCIDKISRHWIPIVTVRLKVFQFPIKSAFLPGWITSSLQNMIMIKQITSNIFDRMPIALAIEATLNFSCPGLICTAPPRRRLSCQSVNEYHISDSDNYTVNGDKLPLFLDRIDWIIRIMENRVNLMSIPILKILLILSKKYFSLPF